MAAGPSLEEQCRKLGELLDSLDRTGLLDSSVVVLFGDHPAISLGDRADLDFEPRPLAISGLLLFRYLGGPWEPLGGYRFRGARQVDGDEQLVHELRHRAGPHRVGADGGVVDDLILGFAQDLGGFLVDDLLAARAASKVMTVCTQYAHDFPTRSRSAFALELWSNWRLGNG